MADSRGQQSDWSNPPDDEIIRLLREVKVIAIVGLSDDKSSPSFGVAEYLKKNRYRIIPVNPNLKEWFGEKAYPDLKSIPFGIDVVDIFRRAEHVSSITMDAVAAGAKAVWMQEGVISTEAYAYGKRKGIMVIMNRCMAREHMRHLK